MTCGGYLFSWRQSPNDAVLSCRTLPYEHRLKMLMFLQSVEYFSATLHAASTTSSASDTEDAQFAEFVGIVNKYIRAGSPFEVNIESKTRIDVLKMTDKTTFCKQTLVRARTSPASRLLLP